MRYRLHYPQSAPVIDAIENGLTMCPIGARRIRAARLGRSATRAGRPHRTDRLWVLRIHTGLLGSRQGWAHTPDALVYTIVCSGE